MLRTCLAVIAVVASSSAHAAPSISDDDVCGGAMVALPAGKVAKLHAIGTVKSIVPQKQAPTWYTIVVAGAKGDQTFDVSVLPVQLPFKVGEKIDVSVRRVGSSHRVHDGLIKDAAGKILLVASGSGASDWAGGWKVTTGKVVRSEQNPNTKKQSLQRTHELDFARGNTQVTVAPDECTKIEDGTEHYRVVGSGHSWLGQRPPGGVDSQTFSMVRK
jgi:hypothetical protein